MTSAILPPGNVWRGLLAFAKLRAWVLPAEPAASAAAAGPRPAAAKERPLQLEGCYFPTLREEWEERERHCGGKLNIMNI